MSRLRACLILLMLCVGIGPASAQCQQPAWGWSPSNGDVPIKVAVQSGINAGQTGQITRLFSHGNPNTQSYDLGSWLVEIRRTADGNGNQSNTLVFSNYFPAQLVRGCEQQPEPGPGCASHGYLAQRFRDSGTFDLEATLQNLNPPVGTYECKIVNYQGVYTVSRTWGLQSNPQVTFMVADQDTGEYVSGATLVCHRVDNPGVSVTIGPTVGGIIVQNLALGDYVGEWTGNDLVTKQIQFAVVNTGANVVQTLIKRVGSNPNNKGHLRIFLVDGDGGDVPITNGLVVVNGVQKNSGNDGLAEFREVPEGSYTAQCSAAAWGRQAGPVQVRVSGGLTRTYRVRMFQERFPEVVDITDDEPGLWEKLFVPKQETLQSWETLIDSMKNWGPFGVVNAFFTHWNLAQRAGERELVFEVKYQPSEVFTPWVIRLDLRPEIALPAPPYEDGGRGSMWGGLIATVRPMLGGLAWIGWLLMLWRVAPRMLG